MRGAMPEDKERNAAALRAALGALADDEAERLREQEEADEREREERELACRRWLAEEASMDCE